MPVIKIHYVSDTKEAQRDLNQFDKAVDKTFKQNQTSIKSFDGSIQSLFGSFGKFAGAASGILAVGIAIKSTIQTAARFETLQVRLNNLFGSVEAGERAFREFNEVAKTTPFALEQVVEAGATLKAFGVDAEASIKIVSDLAAFMGVDVVSAANAMGRAFAGGAGAADIFRERGVLNLIKMSQGIDDFQNITLEQFREAMFRTFADPNVGVIGSTSALAETLDGKLSNLGDSFVNLSAKIGSFFLPVTKNVIDFLIAFTKGLDISIDLISDLLSMQENLKDSTEDSISDFEFWLENYRDGATEIEHILEDIDDLTIGEDRRKAALQVLDEIRTRERLYIEERQSNAEKDALLFRQLRETIATEDAEILTSQQEFEIEERKRTQGEQKKLKQDWLKFLRKIFKDEVTLIKLRDEVDKKFAENEAAREKALAVNRATTAFATASYGVGLLSQLFGNNKDIAIIQSLINTAQGITRTLAEYPVPLNFALAALVGAAGVKQVSLIKSYQTPTPTRFEPPPEFAKGGLVGMVGEVPEAIVPLSEIGRFVGDIERVGGQVTNSATLNLNFYGDISGNVDTDAFADAAVGALREHARQLGASTTDEFVRSLLDNRQAVRVNLNS